MAPPDGAVRLRCAFPKLVGEVTREGLWLKSTVPRRGGQPLPRGGGSRRTRGHGAERRHFCRRGDWAADDLADKNVGAPPRRGFAPTPAFGFDTGGSLL